MPREQSPGEALAALNEQMDTLIEAAAGVRAKMEVHGFCPDAAQVTALQYLSVLMASVFRVILKEDE